MKSRFAILLVAALGAGAGARNAPAAGQETIIPYVRSQGVIEWKVAAADALYIRGMNGKWYYVRTQAACPRLRTAQALGFVASPGDRLDRYSTIIAEGWRCQVASITRSSPPPPAVAKHG
jgi:hypothetical protein